MVYDPKLSHFLSKLQPIDPNILTFDPYLQVWDIHVTLKQPAGEPFEA